jgi:uncharacterized protein YggE
MKKVLLFLGIIFTLALSACATPVFGASPVQQVTPQGQVATSTQQRTISVNGTGQVTLTPDVAYIYIGVHSQSADVSEALNENNTKAQAVSSSLQELGIDQKDIQTSGFNIYPQQQYSPDGTLTGTTYNVDNTVYVTVRDLQLLGRLLETVVQTGANSINGITFDVMDKSKALTDARKLAIDSARSQASEIAQAAGVTLGELQTINVYSSNPPVPMYEGRGGAAMDAAASVPIAAGQIILRVEVNAIYSMR